MKTFFCILSLSFVLTGCAGTGKDIDDRFLSCNNATDCQSRLSHCSCQYQCINSEVMIKDCGNDCPEAGKPPECICLNNQCQIKEIDK